MKNKEESEKRDLSRRAALKVIAAAGVGGALTTLPGAWVKPLVEIGVLPAHAQTSLACSTTWSNEQAQNVGLGICDATNDESQINLQFDFVSTVGVVAVDTWAVLPASEWNSTGISAPRITSGDQNGGQIQGNICVDVTNNPNAQIIVEMTQADGASCQVSFTGPFTPP